MKKILALLILLTLVVSVFAACKKDETPADDNQPPVTDTPVEQQGPTLEDAKVVVRDLYKQSEITPDDFNVVASVLVDGVKFTVTWATDSTDVVIAESTKENAYLVDIVPAEPEADIPYVLTATITATDGSTLTTTFNLKVPKFQVNTYAEYVAAEADAPLVVEGVVYGIMSKAAGDKENSVFVQDLNGGGYYVYGLTDDPTETGVQVGQTVRVRGVKAIYNGTLEIKNASIEIRSTELTTVTPTDLTAAFTAASTASNANLLAHLGEYVVIKGVTVLEAGSNGYYYFELDGVKTYVRISSSSNCTTKAQEDTIIANHAAKFYFTADVAGIASIYQGNFYLMPVDDKAFDNFGAEQQPLPDSVKAGMVKDALTLPTEFVAATPYTLPTTGTGDVFADVAIAWALTATENATLENNVLTPVMPAEGSVTITLTATITKGEAALTKEFTITLKVLAPISLTEAAEKALLNGSEKYIVEGTIKSIANTTYGNVYIQDAEGNELYIYGMYDASGAVRFDKLANQPKVGDKVVLYGALTTYNGTAQMKNGWLLSLEHGVKVTVVEATCNEAGYTKYEYTCECGLEDRTEAGEAALGHNFVDGVCSRCQAQDHVHSYTSETTAPTCTAAGVITYTCACNDSYTEAGEAALGHIDENGDFKCDRNCGTNVLPAEGTTLTIAQALAIGALYSKNSYSGIKYYITGTVVNVENTTYGNMNITDGTNTILVYGVYSADGTVRYDAMETKPVTGDTITVYGEIGFYSAAQMKNGWMTAFEAHTCDYSAATCTIASVCKLCGAVNSPALGHNYVEGVCDREGCGVNEPTGNEPVAQTYVLKTIASDGTAYYWDGSASSGKGGLTSDASKAVTLYMEETTGGVYVYYFNTAGAKVYLACNGSTNTSFKTSTTAAVMQYDSTNGYLYYVDGSDNRYVAAYGVQDIRTYKESNIPGNAKNTYFVLTIIE